jgi:transcriptional regulator with XRE-family HTH domain
MARGNARGPKTDTPDTHVGNKIRSRRLELRLSQKELASAVGVTYQQIQKYENGTSRLGVGRLRLIAEMLRVPPSYFFAADDESPKGADLRLMRTLGASRLVRAYADIADKELQRTLVRVAELLAAQSVGNSLRE